MHSVESLFKCVMNLDSNALRVPHDVELQFVTHPEMILSCLEYFADIRDNKIEKENIPLMDHITGRSFAHTMQYHSHMHI